MTLKRIMLDLEDDEMDALAIAIDEWLEATEDNDDPEADGEYETAKRLFDKFNQAWPNAEEVNVVEKDRGTPRLPTPEAD